MKKIVTHNGNFHADDVFAVATLQLYLDKIGEKYKVIRTRDQEIVEAGDFVVDVGGVYDEDINRYDHHQESFKETGLYKIPYSSFGLVWKHFGLSICENKNVWKKITADFVTVIDANDNGINTALPTIENLSPISPEKFVLSWMPSEKNRTQETLYSGFIESVRFAKGFLERNIERNIAKEELRDEFETTIKNKKNIFRTDSVKALVLPKPLPWKDFLDEENDFDFMIYQGDNDDWIAQSVATSKNSMKPKVVKRSWVGLTNEVLSEKSGVKDLVFYHKTGYILVAKTKDAIIEALKKI